MTIVDLRAHDVGEIAAEVCIVGSGPSGLSIACELLDGARPMRVVVVESGGSEPERAADALSEIESVGLRRAPQDVTRHRGFGGTSTLWTGRCGQLDEIDFLERAWVPGSGWPIDRAEIGRYMERAGRFLGLGPVVEAGRAADLLARRDGVRPLASAELRPLVYQFSRGSGPVRALAAPTPDADGVLGALQHSGAPTAVDVGAANRRRLEASDAVTVVLGATVTEVDLDDHGAASGVTARSLAGRPLAVRAPIVVLAAGGIDNARLLLASTGRSPAGVGNQFDQVGRHLADHPLAEVAAYRGVGSRTIRRELGQFWLDRDGVRQTYSFGAGLAPAIQRREELLNAAIHIVEYGEGMPAVSRMGEGLRALRDGDVAGGASSVARAVAHPLELVSGLADRYGRHRPTLPTPTRVSFSCVVEQVPDPDSRVTLSDVRDEMGEPRARIDWRAHDREYETARRMADLLAEYVERRGEPVPPRSAWLDDGPDEWRSRVHDMAHPCCATRMSASPRRGVVDEHCEVHGAPGVFVAGSSTFSTSGHMNPTLTAVALSIRLADHLRARSSGVPAVTIAERTVPGRDGAGTSERGRARLRVGLVGVGERMRDFHLPVAAAFADDVEIVGCCGRPDGDLDRYERTIGAPAYPDVSALTAGAAPDFIVSAVHPGAVESALAELVDTGVPLLLETPFCWSLRSGRAALRRLRSAGTIVGVCEQFPFLPEQLLARRVVATGLIGAVRTVTNEAAVYDYHGIALARAYVDDGREARHVVARRTSGPAGTDPIAGEISYGSTTVRHEFERRFEGEPSPLTGEIEVDGSTGRIVGDRYRFGLGPDAAEATVQRDERDGRLLSLSVETPLGPITWHNPLADHALDDEQLAVGAHWRGMIDAVRHGALPIHTAEDGYRDVAELAAMRFSADQDGREVDPDPNPVLERVRGEVRRRVPGVG